MLYIMLCTKCVDSKVAKYATNNERISRLICTVRLSNVSNRMVNASNVSVHASHDLTDNYMNIMTPDEMYAMMGIQKQMKFVSVKLIQQQIRQYDAMYNDRIELAVNIFDRYRKERL